VDNQIFIESDQRSILSEMLFTSSRYLQRCIRAEEMYVVSSLLTLSLPMLSKPPAICGWWMN